MTKYYQLVGGVGSYKIKIQKLHALCEHISIGTSYSEKYPLHNSSPLKTKKEQIKRIGPT